MKHFILVLLLLTTIFNIEAVERVTADLLFMRDTTLPTRCKDGELRSDTADSLVLKRCDSNSWYSYLDAITDQVVDGSKTFERGLVLKEIAEPLSPSVGYQEFYIDIADNEAKRKDSSGVVSLLGGGAGGGVNIIFTERFEENVNAASFTSGNSADFDNGGSLNSTKSDETTVQIKGTTSFKLLIGASATNDWFKSPAITVEKKEQGNNIWISGWYTYDGDNDDIVLVGYDNTNSVVTSSQSVFIQKKSGRTQIEFVMPIADNTTSISYGGHVKTGNSGKIFLFDDIEFSNESKIKDQNIVQTLDFSEAGNTLVDRAGQVRFSGALTDANAEGPKIFKIVDNSGSTRTDFECLLSKCYYVVTTAGLSDTGDLMEYLVNGVLKRSGTEQSTGNFLGGALTFALNAGEVFSVGVRNGNVSNAASTFDVRITATSSSPHSVTSTNVPKTYSEANGDFTVTGASWTTTRAVAVYYMAGDQHRLKFTAAGARATGASITTYVATISGVTFKNVANFNQAVSMSASNLSGGANIGHAIANPNAGTITAEFSSNDPLSFSFSGDVELDSKPTWADNVSGQVGLTIPASQVQLKLLVTDKTTTGVMSDLTFTGLTPGLWYELTGQLKLQDTGSGLADVQIHVAIKNGTDWLEEKRFRLQLGSANITNFSAPGSLDIGFFATDTSVTFDVTTITAGNVSGGSSRQFTYAILKEYQNVIETTKF